MVFIRESFPEGIQAERECKIVPVCLILTVNLLLSLKSNPSFSKATMYVASKQRYGEYLDSLEHTAEKHKGTQYVLCSSRKKKNLRDGRDFFEDPAIPLEILIEFHSFLFLQISPQPSPKNSPSEVKILPQQRAMSYMCKYTPAPSMYFVLLQRRVNNLTYACVYSI